MLDFGLHNMDCMEAMKQFPDNYFDLAIVDPPYGDGNCQTIRGVSTGSVSAEGSTNIGGYRSTPSAKECQTARRNMGLSELAEHGRRNLQKNHSVGRCAAKRVL